MKTNQECIDTLAAALLALDQAIEASRKQLEGDLDKCEQIADELARLKCQAVAITNDNERRAAAHAAFTLAVIGCNCGG